MASDPTPSGHPSGSSPSRAPLPVSPVTNFNELNVYEDGHFSVKTLERLDKDKLIGMIIQMRELITGNPMNVIQCQIDELLIYSKEIQAFRKEVNAKFDKLEATVASNQAGVDTAQLGKLYSDVVKNTIVPSLGKLGKESELRENALVLRNIPEEEADNNLEGLIRDKVPSLVGRPFKASRMGKRSADRARPILILPRENANIKSDIKLIRNGIPQNSRVRISFWKSPAEKEADSALFKAGIEAKNRVGGNVKFFQIRGHRLRLVKADNNVCKLFYDSTSKEIAAATEMDDPNFDKFFPALK